MRRRTASSSGWRFQASSADCAIMNTAKPQPNDSTMNSGASTADW